MITRIRSCAIIGLETIAIEIEVHIQRGLPAMQIIGLGDLAIRESKDRVKSAITLIGYEFPKRKIVVNLAPASIKKMGSLFDLPIAIGILISSRQLNPKINLDELSIAGELSLNGQIKRINGAMLLVKEAKLSCIKAAIVPEANKEECAFIQGIELYPVKKLDDAINLISNPDFKKPYKNDISIINNNERTYEFDFSDVKGQYQAKRGLEVASAGNHNVLMVGPPGCGKTMMAKRLPSILPLLSIDEALETTEIYSVNGTIPKDQFIIKQRPFRNPHHTASDIAIIGGGHQPKPGEVSLAHNGILFLDEIAEFKKNVLQVLREPLEEGKVSISRAEYSVTFPSSFMLLATMNPCPCGYLTDPARECRCTALQRKYYLSKISGPLFDRIDLQLELNKVSVDELSSTNYKEEPSYKKLERVMQARDRQERRFKDERIYNNGQMGRRQIDKYCKINGSTALLLRDAILKMNLSARAHDKILKLSRSIADLADRESIMDEDILEALEYRHLEQLFEIHQ